MRVAVTGTPGTGKTSATRGLEGVEVIHLNDAIREEGLHAGTDEERGTLVADLEAIRAWLDANAPEGTVVVESHLAHLVDADRVVVLRCAPEELERRLRERDERAPTAREDADPTASSRALTDYVRENAGSEPPPRALTDYVRENAESEPPPRALTDYVRENAESEALDLILAEAVERHGEDAVYEVDTTDRTVEEVTREVEAAIAGERAPSAGTVDFIDYL